MLESRTIEIVHREGLDIDLPISQYFRTSVQNAVTEDNLSDSILQM